MRGRAEEPTAARHGDPLDLKADGDEWADGTILRAANGKTANASAKLSADGKKLEVTGSRGFASRSQTWERIE